MEQKYYDALADSPIITAVKDDMGLKKSFATDSKIVFILYGTICNIAEIVDEIKATGKFAVVHIDLIEGLSGKEEAVEFIKTYTKADGIISTKPNLIKKARKMGMFTVLRVFVIDSMALNNVLKQYEAVKPDVVEVLPGVMHKVTRKICEKIKTPVIAGGLISDKEDVMEALGSGVTAISTTNQKVWEM